MTEYDVQRVAGDATLFHAHAVRRTVFIEGQDVPEDIEMDGRDEEATHFVAYDPDDEIAVGTARLRFPDPETAKAERLAVLTAYRGDGLGRELMERLEDEARQQGCSRVCLHAQTTVVAFYERLGYNVVSEEFEQAGIPHVEMVKELD